MPALNDKEYKLLLEIIKNAKPTTKHITEEEQEIINKEVEDYFQNKKNIKNMNPHSIYTIITKLTPSEQIIFFKENIKYIKEKVEDIFLFDMMYPKSLSYYLSLEVLKFLKSLDIEICKKILSHNIEDLVYGYTHEDFIEFCNIFYDIILEINNSSFIYIISCHNRLCYNNLSTNHNINTIFNLQKSYNEKFIKFILDKFQNKIDTFNNSSLLNFISEIEDINIYKKFIYNNLYSINLAFANAKDCWLDDYLSETDGIKQHFLVNTFFENIVNKRNIKTLIHRFDPTVVIDIYIKDKEIFKNMTLSDWLFFLSEKKCFNNDFKKIIDEYKLETLETFFIYDSYISCWEKKDVSALKYIELKYRNSIKNNKVFYDIKNINSIFRNEYIKNIEILKKLFKINAITRTSNNYKEHLNLFISYLKDVNIINDMNDYIYREIEKLFYRIVMGESFTVLFQVRSIEEITLLNRLGKLEFNANEFTVFQLKNYNVKLHKSLCKQFKSNEYYNSHYQGLILKLIFIIGYKNTISILNIDNTIPTLEHLVGNIDVKNIRLDNEGNPILNKKIMNYIFSKDNSKIKDMLLNKESDLYKYFPRIFNEWEIIQINNKDKSLNTIIEFLKSDTIVLPPKYYRLKGLFKFIGCKDTIISDTLNIHNQMLKRTYSSIPRIVDKINGYEIEILKLNDMNGLSVGSRTDCCFTVRGNGYSCLKHALLNNNGRILVIKKDGELLAHSWLWRNGDTLCLDNIEITKSLKNVDFLEVYLKLADNIIKVSSENETYDNCIKNVTIGFTNFDKKINGIEAFPCLISKTTDLNINDYGKKLGKNRIFLKELPQPFEEVGYTDSKKVQYLIRGTENFNLKEPTSKYYDERNKILHYSKDENYNEDYLNSIVKVVNALNYLKYEESNMLSSYRSLDITTIDEIYCNDDWFIIRTNNNLEVYINSNDNRAIEELNTYKIKFQEKRLKKI